MNIATESLGVRRTVTAALLVAVFLAHCLIGFVLYRGRAVSGWRICDSDAVVFGVPFLLALAGYAYVLFASPWSRRRSFLPGLLVGVACIVLVLLSTWCYMFEALNTYGS